MNLIFSTRLTATVLTVVLLTLSGCKKAPDVVMPGQVETPTGNSSDEPGVATKAGKPIGVPLTQTIGPSGGNLTTPDGQFTLEVPAGALDKPTALTLQLVENKAPSGAGPAFILAPKDTKLNKPVSLVWHYTTRSISGSSPDVVGIAFQDDKGIWQGKLNTEVDKVKQTILARMRNFSHPMAWYEQYYMTPQADTILPNEHIHFTVYFEPGRTRYSPNPDDDLFVPLPNPVKGDDALRELTQKELRNWKLNGELNLNDDRRYLVGSLDRLGQGGEAAYIAPRAMVPKADNPLAVSVELNLTQKGVITLVSNLTMTDAENEFKIGSKLFKNAHMEVIAEKKGTYCEISLWENVPKLSKDQANVRAFIDPAIFMGNGTYVLEEKTKYLNVVAFDQTDNYGIQWVPQPNVLKYGPVTITITEFGGPGMPVSGRISATLHNYIEKEKRWEHVDVSARFRVINNYFTGG